MRFPYPIVVTTAFLLLGGLKNLWHPAWLLFLTIPIYYSLISAIEKRSPEKFAWPVLVAILYLCLGFFWSYWAWGWLVFLTIPIYYMIFAHDSKGE